MNIKIVKAGILDTLQDEGRFGFSKWGINTSGAMDRFAMHAANALVANDLTTSVLEIHFPGPEIVFPFPALISLTGADFSPFINDQAVPVWKTIQVSSNSVLRFSRKQKGMRCYLAIHGGFGITQWLGSISTNLKSHSGGFDGRGLKKNDDLPLQAGVLTSRVKNETAFFPWTVNIGHVYAGNDPIYFILGNEWNWLDDSSQDSFTKHEFSILPSSDRMAAFLSHEPLSFTRTDQLLSSAVTLGTIQALPSGKLCVLMSDHQTTGGYPRVGHVVSAHVPRFAQLSPGETFTFKSISTDEAEKMLFSLQSSVMALATSVKQKLINHYGVN